MNGDQRSWLQNRLRRFHIEASGARERETYAVVLQETVADFEQELDPFTVEEWDAIATALAGRKLDCKERAISKTGYWAEQATLYDRLYWKVMQRRGLGGALTTELEYEEKQLSEDERLVAERGQSLHDWVLPL